MGAKLGLSLGGSNTDWRVLRTESWGRYFDLRGKKTDRGGNCTIMEFITFILHLILSGWLNQGGWGGLDACGRGRGVYRVLVGRPEGKGPLGRSRRRLEDNIKMELWNIGIAEANWIRLGQDGVRWRAFLNTSFIKKTGYFLTSWVTIRFSKNILNHRVSKKVSK
jgi:hypothetical protein